MTGEAMVINGEDQFEELLSSGDILLIDFWAAWCGPCMALAPTINAIAEQYRDRAKICKLNIDENRSIALKYNVMSIPTVLLFNNGKEVERIVGLKTKAAYEKVLDTYLA
jgi:thioredoxin 1